jgi:uncharacterized membrane protein YhaH (DUF805 family)
MSDTVPNTPIQPQLTDVANQSVQEVTNQVKAQAENIADAAKQLANDPTKAVGMVADQVNNLSQAVGVKDLVQETTGRLLPMKDFVLHTLKVAFFIEKQQRVSRGEFMIWGLSSMIVMGIVSSILPVLLWGMGLFLSSILMLLPVLNLWVKRFHDMNKPARWAIMLVIPFFWWIMPALFKWENENNTYWPDPVLKAPTDSQWYIIMVLSLIIVSSMLITILWAIWVSVSSPVSDVNPTDPSSVQNTTKLPATKTSNLNPTKTL